MDWIAYVVASLFFILGAGCVLLVVLQLPGTWIMLALAVIIEWADQLYLSDPAPMTFGWWALGTALVLTGIGELLELVAGAAGAKGGGATKRGIIGSLIGGIVGAIGLTFFIPVPIVGTLIGAVVGSFMGAVIAEVTGPQPRTVRDSMKPAIGASIGRVLGTFAKLGVCIIVWLVLSVAAFWP